MEYILENAHVNMCKHIQGLPRTSSGAAVTQSLSWLSMQSWVAYKILVLMWSTVLLASTKCIYKCILIECLMKLPLSHVSIRFKGPMYIMYETCAEYGLSNIVITSIISGSYMSYVEWRRTIKRKIWCKEKESYILLIHWYIKVYGCTNYV